MSADPPNPQTKPQAKPKAGRAGVNFAVELGPALLFMLSYNLARRSNPEDAIFLATGVFMAATLAALLYAWRVQKRLPPMLILTGVIVTVFGGLTIALRDDLFVKVKPTIINGLFCAAIFGGLLLKRNPLKLLLGSALELPERIWTQLAIRFGVFYAFLAVLNEVIWRNFSEAFWVNFKVVGVLPITLVFLLLNGPLIARNLKPEQPQR